MTLEFIHLCDLAFLSADGKVNIIGIFDQLAVNAFPATRPRFFVVGGLKDISKIFEFHLRVIFSSSNKLLQNLPVQRVILPEGHPNKHTFVFEISNASFPYPGTYTIEVMANNTKLGSARLKVSESKPPSRQASA